MGDAYHKESESSGIESISYIQKEHKEHFLEEVYPQMYQQEHSI